MRNLLEYPITGEEVLIVVQNANDRCNGQIGGLDQCVLYAIKQYFIDHPDQLHDIVEGLRV